MIQGTHNLKRRRLLLIALGTFLIIVHSGAMIWVFIEYYAPLSPAEIRLLLEMTVSALAGGVMLMEWLIATRSSRAHQQNPGLGFRLAISITVAIGLALVPVIVQGALAITGFGVIVGMLLDGVVRASIDRLPLIAGHTTTSGARSESGYYELVEDYTGHTSEFESGDVAIWRRREYPNDNFWGTKVTVIELTPQRVKIGFVEGGECQERHVKASKLVPEHSAVKRSKPRH